MSLFVFVAVLGAALLHAGWNALVKMGGSRLGGMLILTLVQGTIGAVMTLFYPLPQGQIWLWLLASGLLHTTYKLLLTYAYIHGDLSRVYPIARGGAPMVVLVVGALFLSDAVSTPEVLGIVTLGAGILLMARGVFSNGESRRLLPFALGSALATASYTLVDGLGARAAGDAGLFVAWMFMIDALIFAAVVAVGFGTQVFVSDARTWRIGLGGGIASFGAYAIAVWAMTQAPIALVSALRETSILFALLLGGLMFNERMDRGKAVAAGLIVRA